MTPKVTVVTPDKLHLVNEALVRATARPCALCGKTPAGGSAIWFPADKTVRLLIGTPPGKIRSIVYGLCCQCQESPGFPSRVEAVLLSEFASRS